jgi:hypothetical protein
MDPKDYYEFMDKVVKLAHSYGLELDNTEGELSRSPETLDIILEFVHKDYLN